MSADLADNPYGDESSLVSRQRKEVRLAPTPNCWVCVDVGRTRAICPTHLSVTHGSALNVRTEYLTSVRTEYFTSVRTEYFTSVRTEYLTSVICAGRHTCSRQNYHFSSFSCPFFPLISFFLTDANTPLKHAFTHDKDSTTEAMTT